MVNTWMIYGIGIETQPVEDNLNAEKLKAELRKIPEFADALGVIGDVQHYNSDEEWVSAVFAELQIDSAAELLSRLDRTQTLTYSSDGNGNNYLFYPPSFPWQRVENEPETAEQVIENITKLICSVTNLAAEKIAPMIDEELQVECCG